MTFPSSANFRKNRKGWALVCDSFLHLTSPPPPPVGISPYLMAWRKQEHYTNDIEKWGWGRCSLNSAERFCRPQPCGPIKAPDAVRGPLTAADVPLAKHGESLGWRKAPGSALRRNWAVGAIGLTWLLTRVRVEHLRKRREGFYNGEGRKITMRQRGCWMQKDSRSTTRLRCFK